MKKELIEKRYRISIIGYGNVSYRLSITLKMHGHTIEYICGRDIDKASKLAYILNKPEYSGQSAHTVSASDDYSSVLDSDVVILAVSDNAIDRVASELYAKSGQTEKDPLVLHTSGATPMAVLDRFTNHGVLYPMMTLSATKPIDFSIIPFFLEANSQKSADILAGICYSFNSEYRIADSDERAKLHVAAVYVSNFINYLAGLAYDLSTPNHMFLMPLAIETVRKAFLYEHPSVVQTGPAKRGDTDTIGKHLALLAEHSEHKEVYELLTKNIMNKKANK